MSFIKIVMMVSLFQICLFSQNEPVGWAAENGGVTGGAGGEEVTVTNASQLEAAVSGSGRRVIKIQGSISADINVGSPDKTIEGLSRGAELNGTMRIYNTRNIIIKNLIIRPSQERGYGDAIEVTGSDNIWIDHCDISDHRRNIDGLIDIVRESNYITVSWSKLWYPDENVSHRFAVLIGNSDSRTSDRGHLKVTLHHNWWAENVRERMPRARFGEMHVFNSFFNSPGNNYCIGPGVEAKIVVESNHFEGVKDPHIFYNNESSAQIRINDDNQYVNVTGNRQSGQGDAFDVPYPYTLDPGEDVKRIVMEGAGPFNSRTTSIPFANRDKIQLTPNSFIIPDDVYTIQGKVLPSQPKRQPVIKYRESHSTLDVLAD